VIEAQLPIRRTLAASYRDWRRLLASLRTIVLCAFLIIIADSAVADFVPEALWQHNVAGHVLGLLEDALWALLLTPVVIAVHRFVIQDVITSAYTLPLGDPLYRSFVAWLFALKVLAGLPFELLGMMQALGWPLLVSTAGLVVALVAAVAVALRLTILLPAIAVQAPSASLTPALADTRGQALHILAVFFLALIPWVILETVVVIVLGRGIEITGSPRAMIGLLAGGISQTITLTLSAAAASHVFRALADAVNRAPKLQLVHPLSKHHSLQ